MDGTGHGTRTRKKKENSQFVYCSSPQQNNETFWAFTKVMLPTMCIDNQTNGYQAKPQELLRFHECHLEHKQRLKWPSGLHLDFNTVFFIDMRRDNLEQTPRDSDLKAVRQGVLNVQNSSQLLLQFESEQDRRGTCVGGSFQTKALNRKMCFYVAAQNAVNLILCKLW